MTAGREKKGLLDQVRRSSRKVAEGARSVHIDERRIAPHAASLPPERLQSPELDPEHHFLGAGEATTAFFLVLDAVNFGSGYFPWLAKRPGLSGYFSIADCLKDHFREQGTPAAGDLSRLGVSDCLRIFRQDPANPAAVELMGLFARALNDLGRFLQERFDGRFGGVVEEAGGSAEHLIELLAGMPLFKDIEQWRGIRAPFFKRAQLAAADLHFAFSGQGPGRFYDIDKLTVFADNLVPHVLRRDGILQFERELAERIDRGELIPAGSEEEVEIRACTIQAGELLVAELRRRVPGVNAMLLDNLLWHRGQRPEYRERPRHRTRTVFY
jgi:hypothetical protein